MEIQSSKKRVPLAPRNRPSAPALPLKPPKLVSARSSRSSLTSGSSSAQRRKYHMVSSIPMVSSKYWAVFNGDTQQKVYGFRDTSAVEVASLTKIMTVLVSVRLQRRHSVSWDSVVTVSPNAASVIGTTASLQRGDQLRLWDLLFGLMLPSGNDASVTLAEYLGRWVNEAKPQQGFIAEMNAVARELGLTHTRYTNPHGMSTSLNLSTAAETCLLAQAALKEPLVREVVNTINYEATITDAQGQSRLQVWKNTNQMLTRGFHGVKTGVTDAAGPCLCVCKKFQDGFYVIVTILNCKSMEARWHEVKKLTEWAWIKSTT